MKTLIPILLTVPAAFASATLFLYDGFAAGGATPGAGQYQTDPASTNGTNNSALNGQNPTAFGFGSGAWANLDAVASAVHPRAIATGLSYTDGSGNSLVTTPGAAEIFRNGTQTGTAVSSQYKRAQRATAGIAAINDPLYVSALFQFGTGVHGGLSITVGTGQTGGPREHYIGFLADGSLTAGSGGTSSLGLATSGSTDTFAANTTHLVVARFVDGGFGNRTVDLWINPSNITVEGTPDYTFVSDYFEGHNLDAITIGAHMGNSVQNPSFIVDEIRLGSDWESIAPIPEPATYALIFGLAGLGFILRRRLKRS